jgi:hypothetical protein
LPAISLRETGVVFAAFLAASIALTLPLAAHPSRSLPSDLVDTLLNAWIIGWDADRFRHGLQGLWDAPIYFPYHSTLAFSENLLGIAWLVAPVYWMSGNAVLAYNVAFWLSFTIAGLGMYLLVRELTDSRPAAVVAGTFYAFCPFRFAQISHIQMVATGWLPLALWGLHRYFRTSERRWLVVFAAGSALQALSNTYVAYFMAVPIVAVTLDGLVTARGKRGRMVLELSIAALGILVVLAPVGAQYYRVRADYRQVRTAGEIEQGGADVRAYFVAMSGIWRPVLPTPVASDSEKQLFPGLWAPLLAAVALWGAWTQRADRRRWIALYSSIALAGAVLSMGPHMRILGTLVTRHGPYEWLMRIMPGMTGMRVPSRFAIIFMAGLAVVAGCGAPIVLSRIRPRLQPAVLALLLILVVADGWAVPIVVERYPGRARPEDRAVAEWLRAAPPGAVLHLPIRTYNFEELNYQYATLLHGHPLVNGFSGYNTPLQEYLREPRSPLYDYERFTGTVRMLRRLGVRFVVLHRGDYNMTQQADGEFTRTFAGLRASGQIVRDERLLDTQVFELEPWREPPAADPAETAISPKELTLSASEEPQRLEYLADGDLDSRWIGRQGGQSWLEVRFLQPHDVAQVEMQLASRSVSDYPRELQIDAIDDKGQLRTLYKASPYPEFIAGFLQNPAYPRIDVRLPANRTMMLTIREVASYPDWWWSIYELALRQRPLGGARRLSPQAAERGTLHDSP